jgi:voltage-gated potassium channel
MEKQSSGLKQFFRIIAPLIVMPLLGTFGFWFIEKWSFFDSLYMSVITITTVGFEEVHPLATGGRIFVIIYLVVGLGVFTYTLWRLGEHAQRVQLREWLARKTMDTRIHAMRDHFIVAGFGRTGHAICRKLSAAGVPFIVVDHEDDVLADAKAANWPWLIGDATHDKTLKTAGIDHARGLAACLSQDADNVYLVLSARLLAPKLHIVARAYHDDSLPKFQRAGANDVVGLHETGAAKITHLLINDI